MSGTEEVLAAADHLVRAFGSHDTAAYFACFDPGATFIFYTTPARLASRAEYEQLWRTWEREDEFRVLSCVSAQPVGVTARGDQELGRGHRADTVAGQQARGVCADQDGDLGF